MPYVYLKPNVHMRLGILLILAPDITLRFVTFPHHLIRTFCTMKFSENKYLQVSFKGTYWDYSIEILNIEFYPMFYPII